MTEFGRVLTAMVTPFDARGEVDYRRAQELAEALIASGTDGLVVTGTTGESPTLTNEEKLRLYREVRSAIGTRATIVAGTCNYNTRESIELSLEAKEAGVDGILGTVPYYNKPPQDGLYAHFEAIAEAVAAADHPVQRAVPHGHEHVGRDDDPPEPDLEHHRDQGRRRRPPGDGADRRGERARASGSGAATTSQTLPLMSVGGYGIVSVASHLVGKQIQEMIGHFLAGRDRRGGGAPPAAAPVLQRAVRHDQPDPAEVRPAEGRIRRRLGATATGRARTRSRRPWWTRRWQPRRSTCRSRPPSDRLPRTHRYPRGPVPECPGRGLFTDGCGNVVSPVARAQAVASRSTTSGRRVVRNATKIRLRNKPAANAPTQLSTATARYPMWPRSPFAPKDQERQRQRDDGSRDGAEPQPFLNPKSDFTRVATYASATIAMSPTNAYAR